MLLAISQCCTLRHYQMHGCHQRPGEVCVRVFMALSLSTCTKPSKMAAVVSNSVRAVRLLGCKQKQELSDDEMK